MILGIGTQHTLNARLLMKDVIPVLHLKILFEGKDVATDKIGRIFKVETGSKDRVTGDVATSGIYRYLMDEQGRFQTTVNEADEVVIAYEFVPGKVEVFLKLDDGDLNDHVDTKGTFKLARLATHPSDRQDAGKLEDGGPAAGSRRDTGTPSCHEPYGSQVR